MKVALVGLRLAVGNRLMADTLSEALQRLGADVLFVGERWYRPPSGIPTIPVSDGASYGSMFRDALRPRLYRTAVRALAAARPDACYFISVHPANAPLAWAIRRWVRTSDGRQPAIAMHIHDPLPHPGLGSLAVFATQQMQVRFADRIIVYGSSLAAHVRRYYRVPEERIAVIRHGTYRPSREMPPLANGYRWFSFLGRIERYKGLEVFLAAARELHAADPTSSFFVGGTGDLAPYRSAIASLGENVVVQNRELTNEETDDIMQSSWAVVVPYTSGTQSGVIPVAYWNACPVIASRVGALSEVVREGETGFIVERGDTGAVAARMRTLNGDRSLRFRLGGGAFSFYDRWLRWERIAKELLDAFVR